MSESGDKGFQDVLTYTPFVVLINIKNPFLVWQKNKKTKRQVRKSRKHIFSPAEQQNKKYMGVPRSLRRSYVNYSFPANNQYI